MGIRRKRLTYLRRPSQIGYKDKVCLNLFFDESNLKIPKYKQTEYVAHEVLQMKPFIQKGDIYMRFIDTNRWVFDIFPNAEKDFHRHPRESATDPRKSIVDTIELILKNLQLLLIKRHKTTEIITDSQLWFHPEDFGEKVGDV